MNIEDTRDLLKDKFGGINFIEESHQYFIDKDEYTPVSTVIKEYETFVDWELKARNYAIKNGREKESVQREWKLNNLKSTISGTRTHEFGESYTNMLCGHTELICEGNKPQYVKEYNVLIPTYPKEEAIKKFYDELSKGVIPIGAEFKLSTKYIPNARKICGTCDILFWDENLGGYVIGDWKTNKSLISEYNRSFNVCMKQPFNYLIDEALSHYALQFNLYRRMLESVGLNIVDMRLIWLKDDGSYQVYKIGKIDENKLDMVIMKKE